MTTLFKELIDDAKNNAPDVYTELSLDEVEYDDISFYADYCTFEHSSLDIDYLDLDNVESVVDYLLNEFYKNPNLNDDYILLMWNSVQAKNVKEFAKRWNLKPVYKRLNNGTITYHG
jgi:hypothetical protein